MKISIGKIIGAALVAGMIPYHFKKDEETGELEVGGLLWSFKKTPNDEDSKFTLSILPILGNNEIPAEDAEV